MLKAGILGGTGYVGQELVRLLQRHKGVEVVKICSDSYQDRPYMDIYRNHMGLTDVICSKVDYETVAQGIDVLFTSLPYGVLMEHLTQELLDSVQVIDLGVDYRGMDASQYLKYYGKQHKSIGLCPKFTYGLSEWNREQICKARHIANPGCFATAMELALLPLVKEEVIDPKILVDGKTSYSASGRTLTVGTHYAEANESVKPYKIKNHPHGMECMQAMKCFTDQETKITFVPHVVPMQRGLLVSCYTSLKREMTESEVRNLYLSYYHEEPFIQLLKPGMYVETKWVKNSNQCHINVELDQESGQLFVFAAIDNLMKGAAGQAIQNLNLMFGFHETEGIDAFPDLI